MIKWDCNFNIPNASMQTDVALIKIVSIEVKDSITEIKIKIFDEKEENLICEYFKIIEYVLESETDIYKLLSKEYSPSTLV